MTARADVVELLGSRDPQFDAFYRVYAASIPPREQKGRRAMEALVDSPQYTSWVARAGDRVVGMAVVFAPVHADFALLEYMAVDAAVRNQGTGALIFTSVVKALDRRRTGVVLLLEVDSDREDSAGDREIRRRRKAFYQRLGCRAVKGLDYLLPLRGQGKPPIMDLMIHRSNEDQSIAKIDLARWLQSIFVDVYACRKDDERIGLMLTPVSDPVTLEVTS
jgi:GNAT superfamily N-acetyltransferase